MCIYCRSLSPRDLRCGYLQLGYLGRGFESSSRHGCPPLSVLCYPEEVDAFRLADPVQEVLPDVELIYSFRSSSELEQITSPNPQIADDHTDNVCLLLYIFRHSGGVIYK